MGQFITETEIDYHEIIQRGGANGGDEDFAFVRCPHCRQIYLIDYEVDMAYIDAHDLSRRVRFFDPSDVISCINCSEPLSANQIWAALRRDAETREWQVPFEAFRQSAWAWAARSEAEDRHTSRGIVMERMGRAQCLVVRGSTVLMVQTEDRGRIYWCLPGGGIELGESPAEAAVRELREECCVAGLIVRETAVTTYCLSPEDRHYTFLMDIGAQMPGVGFDPEFGPDRQTIRAVEWRTLGQLSEKDRVFLWTAGLLSIAPFAEEALSWPDEAADPSTYPSACTEVQG